MSSNPFALEPVKIASSAESGSAERSGCSIYCKNAVSPAPAPVFSDPR
jgi:hypothetical protein